MDVEHHYDSLIYEEFDIAYNNALNAARATTYTDGAGRSAYQSVSYANSAAAFATFELIGLDKLLEQGHQPVFFPLFLNL
jgi:hypothetical protein